MLSFSPPADPFVAVRNVLAARAKAAGYQNLAIRLRSMKRSPMAVWLANALAREAPKVIHSLREPGTNFRKADSGEGENGIHGAKHEQHQAPGEARRRHGKQILTHAPP
jgi:hypothetical protein